MPSLELSYTPDDDVLGTGTLRVVVETPDIRATREFCSDEATLRLFAQQLEAYPIVAGQHPQLRAGYLTPDGEPRPVIDISIAPFDVRGRLAVSVILKIQPLKSDVLTIPHRVQTGFLTDYASLERFSKDIVGLITGTSATALLATHG